MCVEPREPKFVTVSRHIHRALLALEKTGI